MCLSVNNCCCCINLNVGTKIISIFCTVIAAITVLIYGTAAAIEPKMPPLRWTFYVGIAATGMVQFICGCLLIYGAFAREPKFAWPWAAVSWFKSVTLMLVAVGGVVLLNYNRNSDTTAEISTIISLYFIYALMLYYFASVVNSRRQQMVVDAHAVSSKRLMRHRILPNYYVA